MNLDRDKLCIKIVALDAICNFIVENFFYLKLFIVSNIVLKFTNFENLKFSNNFGC
jgi:hypothetical protein